MDESIFADHFNAIQEILRPYRGRRVADAIPGALIFIAQAKVAVASHSTLQARLLADLDSITSLVGQLGSIMTEEEFEKLKSHYCELQVWASSAQDDGI